MSANIYRGLGSKTRTVAFCVTAWALSGQATTATAEQLMTITGKQEKRFSEFAKSPDAISNPVQLSDTILKVLGQRVNSDLASGTPLAAAMLLEQFDPAKIVEPDDKSRFLELMEKTAEALYLRGKSFPDNLALTKSISISTRLLSLIDRSREPGRLAFTQINLGRALAVHGARFGNHPELDKGIATLRTAANAWTIESNPEYWAEAQLELAAALIASARISETNEKFEEAIAICQTIVAAASIERLDLHVTKANSIIADALSQYGQRQYNAMKSAEAVKFAEVSLNATNKELMPFEWATTMGYLANANRNYAFLAGDRERMIEAIDQYSQSLTIIHREKHPLEWAQLQLDLGNAYSYFQTSASSDPETDLALQAYRQSLTVRSEKDTPLTWAMSQNNLANVTSEILLARRYSTSEDHDAILAGYRDALRVTKKENAPHDWALFKRNLAIELIRSRRAGQAERQRTFDREMEEAMRAQDGYPLDKRAEMHQLAFARIAEKYGAIGPLKEALQHFNDVLTLYTKDMHPQRWIDISRRKASVLDQLGTLDQDPQRLREVVSIYREQQQLIPREYEPVFWSQTERLVAEVLKNIGNMTQSADKLREAETAYLQAIEATPDSMSAKLDDIKMELASLRCSLGTMTGDQAVLQKAVAHYEEVNRANKAAGRMTHIESINRTISGCLGGPYVLPKPNDAPVSFQ